MDRRRVARERPARATCAGPPPPGEGPRVDRRQVARERPALASPSVQRKTRGWPASRPEKDPRYPPWSAARRTAADRRQVARERPALVSPSVQRKTCGSPPAVGKDSPHWSTRRRRSLHSLQRMKMCCTQVVARERRAPLPPERKTRRLPAHELPVLLLQRKTRAPSVAKRK